MRTFRLKKWDQNPILRPKPGSDWEGAAVLNPGAYYDNGKVSLLYRASGPDKDMRIYIGLAESRDGFHFDRVSDEPVLAPSADGFDAGCIEDARVVKMDGRYLMTYAARAHPPMAHWNGRPRQNLPAQTPTWKENWTRSGIAASTDMRHWQRLGPCTSDNLDNRDVMLFPERIGGRYVMIHRAVDRYNRPEFATSNGTNIWLAYSIDMKTWTGDTVLAGTRAPWEGGWMGGGCPPIKTDEGWLTIYHAIANLDGKGNAYRAGVMLLDLENPLKIIARPPDFILEPEAPFELEGAVNRVVFPCGAVELGDELFVYYGAADSLCCVATAKMKDLMDWVLSFAGADR
ncbi:MAG: glycosidase [Planctomycetota bacterium]|nr:glycosidase [Planctomycetota bacterium]